MLRLLVLLAFVIGIFGQCPTNPLSPGDHTITITVGLSRRSYLVHVPTQNPNTPKGLVVVWHGLGDSPANFARSSRFSDFADDLKTYIAVYPEGTSNSFNAGSCCPIANTIGVDDFSFGRAIVADIQNRVCIDPENIHTTGFSNGCMMSQGLGCTAADIFKSSACGSGPEAMWFDGCNEAFDALPNNTISILEIHGTADAIVPYNGNVLLGFPDVEENFIITKDRHRCQNGPRTTFESGVYFCREYYNCNGGTVVEQCTVTRGTHSWFNSNTFYNTEYILNFFGLANSTVSLRDPENLSANIKSNIADAYPQVYFKKD